MAPKGKNSDASNSDKPKKSHKALPLSEMVKVLDLIRKEKNHMLRFANIYIKNLLSVKLGRRKKRFVLVLLSHLRNCKSYGHSAW